MLTLSDWITTLSLVFGGCCSNAITLEHITSRYPNAGVLITFFQFLIVSLYGLPKQFTFNDHSEPKHVASGTVSAPTTPRRRWIPRLKNRKVPLLPYFVQVVLFFVLSTLNNAAFAYHIPMTVHIVFRSGGMIINMMLGWIFTKKRYTVRQVTSVVVVTAGIIMTTLSASKPKSRAAEVDIPDVSLYAMGISILGLALVLSGFLGLIQDWVYARYVAPAEAKASSDPAGQSLWQEHMFYLHSLALPLFYFSKDNISTELTRMGSSPPIFLSLPQSGPLTPYEAGFVVPSIFIYLLFNTCTQLVCVVGVNRLTGRVSSLTVTLILTVRKAISLLLSIAVYGGQGNTEMWVGAGLVFIGTIGYSTGRKSKDQKEKRD
ncbi:UAA transporter [Suillus bovinus]|uniref:UAA transporter n=1 Tax=Suillus bovinus TaxID=48563 RepID=UPI001B87ED36|nr:UAA transporter [Suillus bovinus]KAG2130996.1 UAA transporter [Suillus bovinus]